MPSFRKKARKAVSKYATKRVAKRLGKKVIGRLIPGYGQYQTAKDLTMAGRYVYSQLKTSQVKITKKSRKLDDQRISKRGSKHRRYGIDDFY